MTQQEKAISLIETHIELVKMTDEYHYLLRFECLDIAKKHALITVNEIINNALVGIDLASTWGDYWLKVKEEIIKIHKL